MADFSRSWKSGEFPPGGLSMAHDLAPGMQQKIRECTYNFRYTPEMVKGCQGADRWLPIDYTKDWEIVRGVAHDSGKAVTTSAFETEKERAETPRKKGGDGGRRTLGRILWREGAHRQRNVARNQIELRSDHVVPIGGQFLRRNGGW